ncbi:Fc receptor-like protein 3 [Lithobates pipiens]
MTVRCDTKLNPLRGGTELHFAFYRDGRTVRGYNVSDTYRVWSSQQEDSGNYTCEVRTASDTVRKMSKKLSIQIQRAAVKPVITLSPNWNQFYWGDSVTLSCSVGSPEVYIYWYKGEQRMYWTQSKQYEITVTTTEMYKCSVDDKVYSPPVRLGVIDNGIPNRPVVTLSPPWGTVFENEMITMTCNTAKNAMYYYWKKDGVQMYGNFNEELQIRSSKIQDSGDYQCIAGNYLSSFVRLEVISKAHLILQAPPDVFEGDSFHLRCHRLQGYRDEAVTLFYKDNEQLESTNDILHIQNVSTAMSGMYKCKKHIEFDPRNDGWIWAETYISVQDHFTTPKIDNPPYPIQEGGDMTLTCSTRHNPLRENTNLKFAFYRNGRIVQDFSKDETYRSWEAQLEDSGNYTCEVRTASDTVRKNSNVISILIQELFPTPEIRTSSSSIQEGDEMTLRCHTALNSLRGGTELHFAFYRDGQTVKKFSISNTYRVPSAQLEDSGNYICEVRTASNTVRKNSKTFPVQIQELFTSPEIRVDPSVLVEEGKQVTLECVTNGKRSTSLLYTFYKDSQSVRSTSRKSNYVIGKAGEENSGSYQCSVQSWDGKVWKNSTHVDILVQSPISGVSITMDKGDFGQGESLRLNCSIEKGTSPVFLWLHNETVVDQNSKFYQLQDNGTVLYIQSPQSHHTGTYRCQVSNKLSASESSFVVEAFHFSQITEKPPLGSMHVIWPVLGVLLLMLLFVIILMFVKRRKFSLLFPSLHRQQNQQNSESISDKDRPRDDGRSANEGENGPDESDRNQHLYGNVSSQEEDDICYTYIDISKIQGPTNKKDEPSVVYSVIQHSGASTGSQATQEKDDSANIYQNFNAERH